MSNKNVCFILKNPSTLSTHLHNIDACSSLSNIIRTTLGPNSFMKLIISKMNSILTTSDTNTILRELDVSHPVLKILQDLAKVQHNIGDGTTTVLLLCTEILMNLRECLEENIHIMKIVRAIYNAKLIIDNELLNLASEISSSVDVVNSAVNMKMCNMLKVPIVDLALESINIAQKIQNIKVMKIVGNTQDCCIIRGILLNKNIMHPQMRRKIENGKIYFIDNIEYKKAESQMIYEFNNKEDYTNVMRNEELEIMKIVSNIIDMKVDLVVAQGGISDLALSMLHLNNITCLRRFTKTEIKRLMKLTNEENNIGKFTLFECEYMNNDYYCKILNESDIATVLLKGPTRDILDELEANFDDAVKTAYNLSISKKVVPGGGAVEMAIATKLLNFETSDKIEKKVFNALGRAMKIIPTILLENCSANVLEMMAMLEDMQLKDTNYGVNGKTGKIVDMRKVCMDLVAVKRQAYRAAIETVCMLLKVDGIVETK